MNSSDINVHSLVLVPLKVGDIKYLHLILETLLDSSFSYKDMKIQYLFDVFSHFLKSFDAI